MKRVPTFAYHRLLTLVWMSIVLGGCTGPGMQKPEATDDDGGRSLRKHASQMLAEGQKIFRFDTFGIEAFWGGSVKLHQAIAGAALGGVGLGLSPKQALELGLKVDVTAVPKALGDVIQAAVKDSAKTGKGPLDDPGVTLALLKANAIVGVSGHQTLNGKPIGTGKSEDPFATLAWLANLLAERGRPLTGGMVVITGSLIPTFSIAPGDRAVFTVDGLGEAILEVMGSVLIQFASSLSNPPLA